MGKSTALMGRDLSDNSGIKKELKKHAATIHCSNVLSLLQRKITNALLYHAYKELMTKEEHVITVKQLCRLINYHGNNHAVIKDALRGLISTVIEWNLIDGVTGTENWTASSILASVSLEGPQCYFAYSPRMKQLLYSPSVFGKIDLIIQSKFRSSYGLALYENCIRYRGLPHTKWFDLAMFKRLMGVPETKYPIFRDFKRRVLDKAIDEVNMYSDLFITPEYIKEGRKVARVRFLLKDRAKRTRLGLSGNIQEDDVIKHKLYAQFGLSSEQIEQLLSNYAKDYILEKIALVESSKLYQEGRVANLAGYMISAVKNNYQAPKALEQPMKVQANQVAQDEINALRRLFDTKQGEYHAYKESCIECALKGLEADDKQLFMDKFLIFAEPAVQTILQLQRNKYSRANILDSPQIQALLRQFAMRELQDVDVMSFEEFLATEGMETMQLWQKFKAHAGEEAFLAECDTA